jgi:hypothetical protein
LNLDDFEARCVEVYESADKAALRIFIDACRLQRNAVAADIAKKFVMDKTIEAGIIAANHYGRTHIAQLLSDIQEFKASLREEEDHHQQPQQLKYEEEGNGHEPYENSFKYTADDYQESIAPPKENMPQSNPLFRIKSLNENIVVTPEAVGTAKQARPANPFAVIPSGNNTPHKRKSAVESIRDLKGSPSPKKANIAVIFTHKCVEYLC